MRKNPSKSTFESDIATEIDNSLGEDDLVMYWDGGVLAIIRHMNTKAGVYLRRQQVVARRGDRRIARSIADCRTAEEIAARVLGAAYEV